MNTISIKRVEIARDDKVGYSSAPLTQRRQYIVDHDRQILWISPQKNAGTSIRHALGRDERDFDTEARKYEHYHTIAIIRHPWDRLTSALHHPYGCDGRSFSETVEQEILNHVSPYHVDGHLWPQWVVLLGFRVDRWLLFEHIGEEWRKLQSVLDLPDLPHQNKTQHKHWREQPYEWSRLMPWYAGDFLLCDEWEIT